MDAAEATATIDPAALVLGVEKWARQLASKYAEARHRPDLEDDLAAGLVAELWAMAARGGYDPGRGMPTTWTTRVAESRLPRLFDAIAWPVSIPSGMAAASPGRRRAFRRARRAGAFGRVYEADPPRRGEPPHAAVDRADEWAFVAPALAALDDLNRSVLLDCFGVGRDGPRTLREIAADRGVTFQSVQQRRERALRDVRRHLGVEARKGGAS